MVELKQKSSEKKTNVIIKMEICHKINNPKKEYLHPFINSMLYISLIRVTVMGVRSYTFASSYFESCIESVKAKVWCHV